MIAESQWKLGRGKERFSPRATGGHKARQMHAFILDFGTLELGENTFLLL